MTIGSFVNGLFQTVALAMSTAITPDAPVLTWTGEPTIKDVLEVKALFAYNTPLPVELVDSIIDFAEYWPHTTSFSHVPCRVTHDQNILVTRSLPLGYADSSVPHPFPLRPRDYSSGVQRFSPPVKFMTTNYAVNTPKILNAWTEYAMPVNTFEHPCRKIVFRITSNDQGWSGQRENHGTFIGSYTWFDVGLQKLQGIDLRNVPDIYTELKSIKNWASPAGSPKISPALNAQAGFEHDYTTANDVLSDEDVFSNVIEYQLQFHNRGSSISYLPGWKHYRFDIAEIDPPFKEPEQGMTEEEYLKSAEIDHPFLPHSKTIQRNCHAVRAPRDYEIVWRWDDDIQRDSEEAEELDANGRGMETGNGEFVRSLKVGDIVTVWARARFPGWMNVVESVKIDVYWAV